MKSKEEHKYTMYYMIIARKLNQSRFFRTFLNDFKEELPSCTLVVSARLYDKKARHIPNAWLLLCFLHGTKACR